MKLQKTTLIDNKKIKRDWHELDASKMTLGRLASRAAQLLRGKHKIEFAPHQDLGDHVVVINSAKIQVTGNKAGKKVYHRYSGYPGGLRTETLETRIEKDSNSVIRETVRKMLDDNRLRKQILRRLHVVADDKHQYSQVKRDK